jgi:hypothetical protein
LKVNESLEEEIPNHHLQRQHHLEIVRCMQRVAMMPGMTWVKLLKVDPAKERKNSDKAGIEELRPKDSPMAQFVDSVDLESKSRPV